MSLIAALLLASALVLSGCGDNGEALSAAQAEAQSWKDKYEASIATGEESTRLLEDQRTQTESLRAERDRLLKQMQQLANTESVDTELAKARETIAELRNQLAQRDVPPAEAQADGPSTAEIGSQLQKTGLTMFDRNEYDAALPVLLIAVDCGVQDPVTFYMIAYCYASARNHQAAAPWYERALGMLQEQEAPNRELLMRCLNNAGVAFAQSGDPARSEKLYRKATELDASYPPPYFNLGLLYAEALKDNDRAVDTLRQYLAHGGERGQSVKEMIRKLQDGN